MGLNLGLYVIDITHNRVNMSDVKGLKMLERLLDNGKDDNSLEKIYIVFNKIDLIADEQRENVK